MFGLWCVNVFEKMFFMKIYFFCGYCCHSPDCSGSFVQQIPIFSRQQRATLEAPLLPKKKRDLETNYKRKAGLASKKKEDLI